MPPLRLRVRRSYLTRGIVCAIGFAAIGTWSVLVVALNIDEAVSRRILMAVFFGVFWGAWFFLSLYLIAASCREQLTVTSQSIMQKGVFSTQTTDVPDVTSVTWYTWPKGGSIVIRCCRSRIAIHFDNFLPVEREQLISRLRELVSEDCQNNWEAFVRSQCPKRPQKSRAIAVLCMALFFAIAVVCLYGWRIRLGNQFLGVGVVSGVVGLGYLLRILRFVPSENSESAA